MKIFISWSGVRSKSRGALLTVLLASPALAANLTPNFTGLGTVYKDAAGVIYTAAGAGRVDVTANFQYDINVSLSYLAASIGVPWSETISFALADLGAGTVANAAVNTFDVNGRPATATIQFNTNAAIQYFLDATPWDNSEFTITNGTAALGGGTVNNQRLGNATGAGGAAGLWDLLTLALHEDEHAIGISSGLARFTTLAGATGTTGRTLTIPNTLSGLTNNFNIPITQNSAHYNGGCVVAMPAQPDCTTDDQAKGSATFNLSVVSQPGWNTGQRALPTALDILGICQVEGCTAAQANTNLGTPEPLSVCLLASGLTLVFWRRAARSR